MAIAESHTAFDGHYYNAGEKIPDLGSFVATSTDGKIRSYTGLSTDFGLLKLASLNEKYDDLETGSSALLVDTGEVYKYIKETRSWYKL